MPAYKPTGVAAQANLRGMSKLWDSIAPRGYKKLA
jgi:hypothetical protein